MIHSNFRNAFLAPWRAKALGLVLPLFYLLYYLIIFLVEFGAVYAWVILIPTTISIFNTSESAFMYLRKKPGSALWSIIKIWLLGAVSMFGTLFMFTFYSLLPSLFRAEQTLFNFKNISVLFFTLMVARFLCGMLEEAIIEDESRPAADYKNVMYRIRRAYNVFGAGVEDTTLICAGLLGAAAILALIAG